MAMAASASASTSSAADSNNHYCYDIFINHRGPDVKKTFASHLYRRLISYGLRVFLNYEELQAGEGLTSQIQGAIRNASIHVAIFSPTYAESNCCLDGLLLMLEWKAPILPVFYHMKPDEIRWTRGEGVYVRSLHNLEKKRTYDSQPRYNSTTIENWRNALSRVADISGLDLEAFNGDEGELLDKVVEQVMKKSKKTQLNVARYPTGLDEKVKDFETKTLLQQQSGRVQIVGITGLGGVGKSTLAKELFNRKSANYSKSYFLFDVRENAKISLLSLQRKVLKGLTQSDLQIDSIDEGIEMLNKHFTLLSSPVLLVLDDVDHVEQADALLPVAVKDVLSPNSLILITSRDKNVLVRSGIQESSIYKLTGLNTEHSRQLFCSHAFCQPHPLSGFEHLVDNFLRACDRLPLSLKVFGALLSGNNDKSYWEDELERLEQILPDDIQKRLQICFDALQRDEQQIFLDIACFFIGENSYTAIRIWDGSGWKGSRGFQSLQNKCLAELDNENKIRMHDHLRDLAHYCPVVFGVGQRTLTILLQHSPLITVRGVRILAGEYKGDDGECASLSSYRWRELQLLDIEDCHLEPILRRVQSPNLLWLRWDNFPYSCLPSWIPMKNLRVLKVDGFGLESLWSDELEAPLQLRELEIYGPLSYLPESIGKLKHLERIVVTCGDFLKLQGEFCHRPSLKHLPESLGNLTNLEHFDLSYCGNLERLPNSFGNLAKLKYLNLKYCYNLTLSSRTLENISTLEYINLYRCDKIQVLPSQIAHQPSLEKLNLNLRNLKEWPSAIGVSSDMEKLVLKTPLLETLPPSLGRDLRKLRYLELRSCQSLKRLPDSIRLLNQLIMLTVKDCSLQELPFKMVEGESKTLSTESKGQRNCQNHFGSSIDERMLCLQQFQLRNTQILDEVSFAEGICPTLKHFDIQDCNDLVQVGPLPNALIKLVLIGCSKLRKIKGLFGLAKLQILNISWCEQVEELPSIETLVSLEELQISECVKLKSIRGLEQLTKIRKLDVSSCSVLEDLRVEHLRSLEKLWACSCVKLKSIQGLGQLTQLRELHVFYCSELEELPGFEDLYSLEELWACNCVKLKSIKDLGQLTKLRILNVTECSELETLEGVEYLCSLEELYACECPKLQWGEEVVEQFAPKIARRHAWYMKSRGDKNGFARKAYFYHYILSHTDCYRLHIWLSLALRSLH